MTPMTDADLDAFQHTLIRQRIRALLIDDLKGRPLQAAREILAYTILGPRRRFPGCPAAAVLSLEPVCPWPPPSPSERVG